MNKRRDVAVIAALVCGAAAGAVIGRVAGGRRPRTGRSVSSRSNEIAAFAPPVPRRDLRVVLPAFAGHSPSPPRRATYETVRVGRPPLRRPAVAVAVAGGGAALTGAILIGIAVANPQVTALAAPSVAYPGTTAVVAYAGAGFGTVSYGVDARSRRRTGVLAERQGALQIPITQRDANSDIVVVVRAAGPFGTDARVARIRVLARPRATVLRIPSNDVHIDALTLSATTVASGGEITVRYRSNATTGSVALRDVRGGTWQSKPFSSTGITQLRAPASDHDVPFNVVLQARRDGSAIENSVALVVTGTAGPLGANAASPAPEAQAVPRDIPAVAQSGARLVTSAGAGRAGTVIELTGAGGIELQRATPRADGTTELRLPIVTTPQSYLITVSYESGAGRESSFHRIRVLPAVR